MWLIILEAALALFMLLFIVWWTMFHKSKDSEHSGESPRRGAPKDAPDSGRKR